MKLISRRGSTPQVMALIEEAFQSRLLLRAQRPLRAGDGGEKRHGLTAPGDDEHAEMVPLEREDIFCHEGPL